jgi:CRP-like cAMP-binding protein
MDLLERARALSACRVFGGLGPPVLIRLAERAHGRALADGDALAGDDLVRIVVSGELRVGATAAAAGDVVGLVRVVAPATPRVAATARGATTVLELAVDDVRDVLEEDPAAVAALADALAQALLA